MNTGRIIGGGLAAGVVMNVVDYVTNGVLLASRWSSEAENLMKTMDAATMEAMHKSAMIGFMTMDMVLGIALVWIYAAIRPRFGAGAGTAAKASLALWVIMGSAFSSYAFSSGFSWHLVGASIAGGLVSALVAGQVGGMIYKEASV